MTANVQQIFGYTDRLAAQPSEARSFHVSCENSRSYNALLVRLLHGFTGEEGPGFLETECLSEFNGKYDGKRYVCQPESYVEINDNQDVLTTPDEFVMEVHVFPTLPQACALEILERTTLRRILSETAKDTKPL